MRNHQKETAIIFIDFKKAFDSVNRNTPEKIVKAIQIMYVNTSAVVLTPEGETTNFNINTGVLQGDPLSPYLFIIVLDYALRTATDDREGLTLTRRRHPDSHLSDLDYADDIALFADTIQEYVIRHFSRSFCVAQTSPFLHSILNAILSLSLSFCLTDVTAANSFSFFAAQNPGSIWE